MQEIGPSALAKAERIAQEELKVLGWSAQGLQSRRKGDRRKVRIAAPLRRETTMSLEWIAERLCMGGATHVTSLLQCYQQKGPNSEGTLLGPRLGQIREEHANRASLTPRRRRALTK